MKYKNLINILNDDAFVVITDEKEINKYEALLKKNELPEDIFYKEDVQEKYNGNTGQYDKIINYKFFKLLSDDEIDSMYKIRNSNSLKSIARSLNFFKGLTIVFLVIMVIFIILSFV